MRLGHSYVLASRETYRSDKSISALFFGVAIYIDLKLSHEIYLQGTTAIGPSSHQLFHTAVALWASGLTSYGPESLSALRYTAVEKYCGFM